jgi:hypothetical protein
MKKLYAITIRGNEKIWGIPVILDEKYLKDWEEDGIDICEIVHTIPEFVQWIGLTRIWCWLQDIGLIRLSA